MATKSYQISPWLEPSQVLEFEEAVAPMNEASIPETSQVVPVFIGNRIAVFASSFLIKVFGPDQKLLFEELQIALTKNSFVAAVAFKKSDATGV